MAELAHSEAEPQAAAHQEGLEHHFEDLQQQNESLTLGMWAFLVTEVMFFGGLFLGYAVYRREHGEAFAAASHELGVGLGAFNTAVLLLSSLTMALSVRNAQLGDAGTTCQAYSVETMSGGCAGTVFSIASIM